MALYRLDDMAPRLDEGAWVADGARVIGNVALGPQVSIWFAAVVRAESEPITLGARSNVQDGAVLHTDPGFPLVLGPEVSVGHQAMLHGCFVGEGSLVGIRAVVLNGARIGRNCLVGAGALVTEGKEFPDGSLILGTPAKVARPLTPEQIDGLRRIAAGYVAKARRYQAGLKVLD